MSRLESAIPPGRHCCLLSCLLLIMLMLMRSLMLLKKSVWMLLSWKELAFGRWNDRLLLYLLLHACWLMSLLLDGGCQMRVHWWKFLNMIFKDKFLEASRLARARAPLVIVLRGALFACHAVLLWWITTLLLIEYFCGFDFLDWAWCCRFDATVLECALMSGLWRCHRALHCVWRRRRCFHLWGSLWYLFRHFRWTYS